jgi:hypothetical protein
MEGETIMAQKCEINGNAKREPNKDGACPECLTPDVPVTKKGFVGAHNVKIDLGDGPQIPVTDEGTRVGDPRDAAVRREIESIKVKTGARPADKDSVADPVITTGHNRGPAMVRGRDMPPVQPQRGWAASAGTMYGPIGRERIDPHLVDFPQPKRTNAQKRKFRARQTAERQLKARLARQSSGKRD